MRKGLKMTVVCTILPFCAQNDRFCAFYFAVCAKNTTFAADFEISI